MKTFAAWVLLVSLTCGRALGAAEPDPWKVDFRWAIPWWQTSICLPDDWQKTLVGKDGEMLYDYPGKFTDFKTRITFGLAAPTTWVKQELASPRVPIVRTLSQSGAIAITEEAFAVCPDEKAATPDPVRYDVMLVGLRNTGRAAQTVSPLVTVESQAKPAWNSTTAELTAGGTRAACSDPVASVESAPERLILRIAPLTVPAGGEHRLAVLIARRHDGKGDSPIFGPTLRVPARKSGQSPAQPLRATLPTAESARRRAEQFWTSGRLPYERFQIPDPGIQALVESSMRNIYQAREIKNGLPAFQVGPTCYRGLWIVDGSFLLEAATYFGCGDEARPGIQYMLSHQRPDGGFTVIKNYWKESGIVLWAVTRHARLTGDKTWLESVWPKLEAAVGFIEKLRREASTDPNSPHFGLLPPGFPDGGLGGNLSEYTNVYWTLAGLRAVIDAAHWLGKEAEATRWQREYDDFYATFRKAADRDMRTDSHGNRYLPIVMLDAGHHLPQRAQWAFCHAVFPGKVFAADDPLVRGNLAMLRATEREGMVFGTGWAADGIWNYFASFYGHAWLWVGDGSKAAEVLYAFANHASPLLAWREEQMPQGGGSRKVGDMPHNWASAEFIRLVRHLLILERGDELHLLEGMPACWAKPGATTRLRSMPTDFGPMSLEVVVTADGRRAHVRVETPSRTPPRRIVLHLDTWAGGTAAGGGKATIDLPTSGTVEREITLPGTAR